MTYYAINGSPRKTHNTATILNKALEGVKAADPQAQTELIHLYSHDFSGCVSCFECKRLGGKSYGKCAVRDGLTPILERLADALKKALADNPGAAAWPPAPYSAR